MSEIALRNRAGETVATTTVDPLYFDALGDLRWYIHRSDTQPYAARKITQDGERRRIFLHRAVVGLEYGDPRQVDHINGDTLDNRRSNLRIVTGAQNAQNQGSRGGTSRFRGVCWSKGHGKWIASAWRNGKRFHLGQFDDEQSAAVAAAAWRAEHMPYSADARWAA